VRIGNPSALPAKRMAVGALFRDAREQVLIVQPTYRPEWLIPGGAFERSASPRAACIREGTFSRLAIVALVTELPIQPVIRPGEFIRIPLR
jgi:hypothetical protein